MANFYLAISIGHLVLVTGFASIFALHDKLLDFQASPPAVVNGLSETLVLTCRPSRSLSDVGRVLMMDMVQNNEDSGVRLIAVQTHSTSTEAHDDVWTFAEGHLQSQNHSEPSFLQVTIKAPSSESAGGYVCRFVYVDNVYRVKEVKTEINVTVKAIQLHTCEEMKRDLMQLKESTTFLLDNARFFKSLVQQYHGMPSEWTLAFRSAKQSGLSVWDTWMNTRHHDDDPAISDTVPFGCLTTDSSLFCDRIYRSQLLDNWKGVKEAQVALFKDKQKVFFVTFNSTGVTDKNNFMSIDRVIDSSVPELFENKVTTLFFNVRGDPTRHRRFFLQKGYGGCENDSGWMVAVDMHVNHRRRCSWDVYPKYPNFLYTQTTTHARWGNPGGGVGHADVLAVYLKV